MIDEWDSKEWNVSLKRLSAEGLWGGFLYWALRKIC
jgi:hypothetical protein